MTEVVTGRAELAAARALLPGPVVLVPTMGALHEGHRSLMRAARARGGSVVVSVFVNPLQFGAGEDLDRYPRTLEQDLAACREEGVSLVFAPTVGVMYPQPQMVRIDSGAMGERVEGVARPGHFAGMLTVVIKLFHLVGPDAAVFGQKDAQQLSMIRRMVADLNMGIEIVGAPTVREPDGLALSSRNRFLSPAERTTALVLSQALFAGREQATPAATLAAAGKVLDAEPGFDQDYLVLVDPATFEDAGDDFTGAAVLAVSGRVGATHLIDNVTVTYSAG